MLANTSVKVLGRCTRCETLPGKIENRGRLYLWFPSGHTLNKVISSLHKAEFDYQLLEDGQGLNIILDKNKAEGFVTLLAAKLTSKELKETQVLWMPGVAEPQFRDFSRVTSLHKFISFNQSDWLVDLLAAERVTTYFQPIVYAADTSQIFAQEALLRGFDEQGNLIPPGRIFSQAVDAGLIFQLDLLARRSAIREALRSGMREHIFINFSPTAIYDPTTCLRMTVRAIDEAGIPHNKVVFEVMESDQPQDIGHLINILRFYQDAGFQVALDDFGTGYSNLNLIYEIRPDFIKLDRHLIDNVHNDPYKALITEKLLEIAQQLNIRTVAEGIECLEELEWVRDRGATFVQGYLIAKPSTPPATIAPYFESKRMLGVA